jgi:ATP synthase protein I
MNGKPRRPDLRRLAELSSLGLILPSSIAVGLFFGYLLDRWLGTEPWLLLTFTVLGIVSGLLSLFRALKKQLKDEPPAPPAD